MANDYIDAFELLMSEASQTEPGPVRGVDAALVHCLNDLGRVDIEYICKQSSMTVEQVISSLKGIIIQDPDCFEKTIFYDPLKGWEIPPKFFSGNISKKLERARRINKRYYGKFNDAVKALETFRPEKISFDEINIRAGAPWIKPETYALFLKDFFNTRENPSVVFSKDVLKYQVILPPNVQDSIINRYNYGVRRDEAMYYGQYYTAAELFEMTLNGATAIVHDYDYSKNPPKPVLNRTKTLEAQEKQRLISEAFVNWTHENNGRMDKLCEQYNEEFAGYHCPEYNGDFLLLPDLNPEITLYPHQREVVARALLSNSNLLLADEVGTGKTYEMIVTAHERYRMQLSKKTLIVVPNNILQSFSDAHRLLYADDNILVVYPKDFSADKRNAVLSKIRDGDYVAVYMAYSSFDFIEMSNDYIIDKMRSKLNSLRDAALLNENKYERKIIISQIKRVAKAIEDFRKKCVPSKWLNYDELGIDTLIVDEAHNYKNIPISTKSTGVVGISKSGSKKCKRMLDKVHYTKFVIFATGTPLTNSIADLYAFQLYLQPETLEFHNLQSFDTWINTFGQCTTEIECDVDSNSNHLRPMTRFTEFNNLRELMSIFSQVCHFHYLEKDDEGLPEYKGPIDIEVPKNRFQREYIATLSKRADAIRSGDVKPEEDNMLKITNDGVKVALDIRLIDQYKNMDCAGPSKVHYCAAMVKEIYNKYPSTVQIVFCDIGTPKASFNVYNKLADVLVAMGVNRDEIAFVHDASTEAARTKMFNAMNKGKIRIAVGSTQKLGTGVNVQKRLIALHHLSVPWRPADMVQREGRILRKGNTCKEVFIYRYYTEGTFDAYSWQLLENKQRFIASFLSGSAHERNMKDISDTVLSYADVKMLAIGNPMVKKRFELSNLLERTRIACRQRQIELDSLESYIDSSVKKRKQIKKTVQRMNEEYSLARRYKRTIPLNSRKRFGRALLDALNACAFKTESTPFAGYRGFDIIIPAFVQKDKRYITLVSNKYSGEYTCEIGDDITELGVSKAIDYLLDHLNESAKKHYKRNLELARQVELARENIRTGNLYKAQTEELSVELHALDEQIAEALSEAG